MVGVWRDLASVSGELIAADLHIMNVDELRDDLLCFK